MYWRTCASSRLVGLDVGLLYGRPGTLVSYKKTAGVSLWGESDTGCSGVDSALGGQGVHIGLVGGIDLGELTLPKLNLFLLCLAALPIVTFFCGDRVFSASSILTVREN